MGRQQAISKFMKIGVPRDVAEAMADEIDDYMDEWTRAFRAATEPSVEEDMPHGLTEQQKFAERQKKQREQERLERIARGPRRRKPGER